MKVRVLVTFIQLLDSVSENKKKINFNNLWERFDFIKGIMWMTYLSN